MKDQALALAAFAAVLLAVSDRARRAAWAVLRGVGGALLAVVALVVERRHRLERPARQLPAGHVWRCTVFVEHHGVMQALASGTVSGPWETAGDVEREAMARWVEVHGWPAAGRLCARAEPVAVWGGVTGDRALTEGPTLSCRCGNQSQRLAPHLCFHRQSPPMTAPKEPSDITIRLAAVEAAGRRLGPTPNPLSDRQMAQSNAAADVVNAAQHIAEYIRSGQFLW